MNRKLLVSLGQILISVLLLVVFIVRIDIDISIESLRSINFYLLIIPIANMIISLLLNAVKWRLLIIEELKESISMFKLFEYNMFGYFFNNFLPSGVGGDSYKIYALFKQSKSNSVYSVVFNRITGLMGLLFVFIFAALINIRKIVNNHIVILYLSLSMILCCFLFAMCYRFRFFKKVKIVGKLYKTLEDYFDNLNLSRSRAATLFILSVIAQVLFVINLNIYYYIMGAQVNFFITAFIFSAISIVRLIPVSFNGWGISENTYVFLSNNYFNIGVDGFFVFLPRICQLIVSLIGGIWFGVHTIIKNITKNGASE